jgi:hypothetical protein
MLSVEVIKKLGNKCRFSLLQASEKPLIVPTGLTPS